MYCQKCGTEVNDDAKFCTKCGAPISAPTIFCTQCGTKLAPGSSFCTSCGKSVAKTSAGAQTQTQKRSFRAELVYQFKDMFRHPKKLIPTIVLTVIWITFSLMSGLGANVPVLRFFYTLTYSNGGLYGGFFGLLGGIFGKAVFAAVVNAIVLALVEKKNPFADMGKGIGNLFGKAAFSGLSAVSPLLAGAGAGLILYWFFNITSAPVNCGVAVAGAAAAALAAGKQNGLLFSLFFGVARKLSGGKTPSQVSVSRALTGFSTGFAVGLPLTFARFGWLLFVVGAVILAAGIAFGVIGKKNNGKPASVTAVALLLLFSVLVPLTAVDTVAAGLPGGFVDPVSEFGISEKIGNRETDSDDIAYIFYKNKVTSFYIVPSYVYHEVSQSYEPDGIRGKHTTEFSDDPFTVTGNSTAYRFDPKISFSYLGLVEWDHKIPTGMNVNINFGDLRIVNEKLNSQDYYEGVCYITYGTKTTGECVYTYDLIDSKTGSVTGEEKVGEGFVSGISNETKMYYKLIDGKLYVTFYFFEYFYFEVAGVQYSGTSVVPFGSGTDDNSGDDDGYVKYRGRLTYTNGTKNKYGQPFPDLMDFDGDGDIDYADRALQHELVHNPNYLDQPASPGLLAFIAVISALFGSLGGGVAAAISTTAAGALGNAIGETMGALGDIGSPANNEADGETNGDAENGDTGEASIPESPYVWRDADGDLNVTDPVTSEKRVYVSNGDGTYTNPLTDATYTESELYDSINSRVENADVLSADAAAAREAISAQREANQGISASTLEYEAAKHAADAAEAHEKYVDDLWMKYGGERGDEESIRAAIAAKQSDAVADFEHYTARAEAFDTAVTVAEKVSTAADVGVDVLATATGNVALKNAYTVLKNTASRVSDAYVNDKDMSGAIAMAGFDSIADLTVDKLENCGFHVTGNVGSETFKAAMQNLYEGKDWDDGLGQAAAAGAAKGVIAKFGSAITGSAEKVKTEKLASDMADIAAARAKGFSQKSVDALCEIRTVSFINNMKAEKALGTLVTAGVDTGKTVVGGVSDAMTKISDEIKKKQED